MSVAFRAAALAFVSSIQIAALRNPPKPADHQPVTPRTWREIVLARTGALAAHDRVRANDPIGPTIYSDFALSEGLSSLSRNFISSRRHHCQCWRMARTSSAVR
jgi:hypothetical protein